MDGNHNFWKNLIAVLLIVLISFGTGYGVCWKKYRNNLDQIESELKELEHERDSLIGLTMFLDEQIQFLDDSLKQKKEQIVYIKIKGDEKVDSVRVLPIDDAIMFLSRELSEEADSAR